MKIELNRKYIISISYGNYLQSVGGVDKCILEQQIVANKKGYSYVYYFDIRHYLKIECEKKWGCIIDGKYVGVCSTAEIRKLIDGKENLISIIIHHFRFLDIEDINRLFAGYMDRLFVYVHDYYMCCAEGHFLKDSGELCDIHSNYDKRCESCRYKTETIEVRNKFRLFWKQNNVRFICPSEIVRELFSLSYPEQAENTLVIPHQIMVGENEFLPDYRKIAYIGMPHYIKGYEIWKKIIEKNCNDYFAYYQFGRKTETIKHVNYQNVRFNKADSMVEYLKTNKIGIVLLWSLCPETYSYTFFEAYAAGAFIITNKKSGNIAREVEKRKCGLVLDNEKELFDLLCNPQYLNNCILSKKYNPPNKLITNEVIFDMFDFPSKIEPFIWKTKTSVNEIIVSIIYSTYRFIYSLLR